VNAQIIQISASIGREALTASRLYGRNRHPADLNFGDCFAYACAKAYRIPLLYKGDDFAQTDLA
jgi:ribonuclease VapC